MSIARHNKKEITKPSRGKLFNQFRNFENILTVSGHNLLSQNLLSQNILCQNLLCQNLLSENRKSPKFLNNVIGLRN